MIRGDQRAPVKGEAHPHPSLPLEGEGIKGEIRGKPASLRASVEGEAPRALPVEGALLSPVIIWNQILERVACAARRSGRNPAEIHVVAVSKGVENEAILKAIFAGARIFGESRIQEAALKFSDTGIRKTENLSLHLIGSLQTNKVKKAVGFFDLIHSVDSIVLAEAIAREAMRQARVQSVLIQVNISGETTKRGVSLKEAPRLIERVRNLGSLRLEGLMTIPPESPDPEASRPYFSRLRELGVAQGLHQFSMGMSNDFEVAIAEGATWVRIGRALFGEGGDGHLGATAPVGRRN